MAKSYAKYSVYAKLRDEKGMTDYSVAKDASIATATLTNWKQEKYTPKADKLLQIAKVLDVPLEMLLSVNDP